MMKSIGGTLMLLVALPVSAQELVRQQADGACAAVMDIEARRTDAKSAQGDDIARAYERMLDDARELCASQPVEDAIRAGEETVWLIKADGAVRRAFSDILFLLNQRQNPESLARIRALTLSAVRLNQLLSPIREQSYGSVRIEEREVIRSVHVPVPCPEQAVLEAPEVNAGCNRLLSQSTRRWSQMATDILGPYGEDGRANDAYTVVVQVRREINRLSEDTDLFAAAVSWYERLYRAANDPANVHRTGSVFDFFQLSESERSRIMDLALDIDSQLRLCGRY